MNEQEEKTKPDCARIFFWGIPFTIISWFSLILYFASVSRGITQSEFYKSIILAAVIFVVYFIGASNIPGVFGRSLNEAHEKHKKSKRLSKLFAPLSKRDIIFYSVLIVLMLIAVFIGELYFDIRGSTIIRVMFVFSILYELLWKSLKGT